MAYLNEYHRKLQERRKANPDGKPVMSREEKLLQERRRTSETTENPKERLPRYPTHADLIEHLRRTFTSATVIPSISEEQKSDRAAKGDDTIEVTFLRRSPKS